jgi:Tfp pilus assembly protein PilO
LTLKLLLTQIYKSKWKKSAELKQLRAQKSKLKSSFAINSSSWN